MDRRAYWIFEPAVSLVFHIVFLVSAYLIRSWELLSGVKTVLGLTLEGWNLALGTIYILYVIGFIWFFNSKSHHPKLALCGIAILPMALLFTV